MEGYLRYCRRVARELAELGVGVVEPGVTVNYVPLEDRDYRKVYEAWELLLQRNRAEDDLWAW